VDILKDGGLDFSDDILKELDIVIASAHLYHRLDAKSQTERIIRAIENPYVNMLGHPSGRLINKRPPIAFDMEKVIDACVANGVALEINSSPARLDLEDRYVRMAKDKGAKFSINTDAHSTNQTENIVFGVGVARRGWLTKADIVNCKSLKQFDTSF